MAPGHIRVLQHNVGGCAQTTAELLSFAADERVDVLAIHEPPPPAELALAWARSGTGPPPSARLYLGSGSEAELELAPPLALTAIANPRLRVRRVAELGHAGCVCLELDLGERDERPLHVVNACLPRGEMEPCLERLAEVAARLEPRERLVYCLETNAMSVWWSGSDESDERAELIEDLILARNLCVANPRSASSGGSELTLVSPALVNCVGDWYAEDGCVGFELDLSARTGLDRDDEREVRLRELRDIFGEDCDDFFQPEDAVELLSDDEGGAVRGTSQTVSEASGAQSPGESGAEERRRVGSYLGLVLGDFVRAETRARRETRKSSKALAWANFHRARLVYFKAFCRLKFCRCDELYRAPRYNSLIHPSNQFVVTSFKETGGREDVEGEKTVGPAASQFGATSEWIED